MLAVIVLGMYAFFTYLTYEGLMEVSLFFWFGMPVIYFGLALLVIKQQFGKPNNKQYKPEVVNDNSSFGANDESVININEPLDNGKDPKQVIYEAELRSEDQQTVVADGADDGGQKSSVADA